MKCIRLAWLVLLSTACAATSDQPLRGGAAGDRPPASALFLQEERGEPAADEIRVLSLRAGMRQFDEDDWSPVEDQVAFGLDFALQPASAPVGFELGLSYSSEDDDVFVPTIGTVDVDTEFVELYAGVHKSFAAASVRPAVGAGLTMISGEVEVSGPGGSGSDDDEAFGFYLHGGIGVPIGDTFEVGVDLRAVLGAELEIAGVDVDADYTQASLFLGWRI